MRIGIEPLNRYETSLVNTVDQALTGLGGLLGPALGLALDTYHLNIEERSSADAVRRAGEHLVHVQVCGSDRGAPGGDQTDWPALLAALDEVGYAGPLNIESFTAGQRRHRRGRVDLAAAGAPRRTTWPATGCRSCAP